VLAGEVDGRRGPVEGVVTSPLYIDVHLPAKGRFAQAVPDGHNGFVYVYEGEAEVGIAPPDGGVRLPAGRLAVLGEGDTVVVAAGETPGRFLVVAARPIGEPVARYGPFVMNTREEVMQAVRDFQSGRLAG
jgi:hypothetical protein